MSSLFDIFNKCQYISKGNYGLIFKYKNNDRYFTIKINYKDDNDKIYFLNDMIRFNVKNLNKIPKKNIYNSFDAENKIYNLLNEINAEDINGKKIQICPKIYKSGIITDKKIINIILNKIKKYKVDINKNIKKFKYIIIDYVDSITLEKYILDNKENLIIDYNNFEEIHTYIFYIIYYLFLIHKKYNIYHNDLDYRNILLSYDSEYDKNVVKYRKIKFNDNIYKVKIYKYLPVIIDFGFASIFNKNIYNQNLKLINPNIIKVKNNKIIINKNYNIIIDFILLIDAFIVYSNYQIINYFITYLNKFKLNKLNKIFMYKKKYIELYNKFIIVDINKEKHIDYYIYAKLLNELNNNDLLTFINRFKINKE